MQSTRVTSSTIGAYPTTVTRPTTVTQQPVTQQSTSVTQQVRQIAPSAQPAQGGVYATTRIVGTPQASMPSTIMQPTTTRTVISSGNAMPTYTQTGQTYTQTSGQ